MSRISGGAVEVVGASVAQKVTTAGAAAGFLGWLSQVNWVGLTGALVAVVGLLMNWYFQHRRDKREAEESAARIQALREQCGLGERR
ncbi:holin [Stutzerimonas kirkiae]|uniref:holin n=1 Tax=Stutzerimonas kirkiae TaxID=2211392 RepID=UPI0010384D81|nr:holin [Stutzerimonas kirkiae]TBV16697.1 holin [Stutzerimonas kirkiae]